MYEAGQTPTDSRSSVNPKQDNIKEIYSQTNHNQVPKPKT